MMFTMHVAIMLGIIGFVAGLSLYIWSIRNEGAGTGLASFFGIIVMILVVVDLICVTYYGLTYWKEGYFQNPNAIMQNKPMMGGSMMNGGNMQNMMKKP